MANETPTLQQDEGVARRSLLKCMLWAGSGVLWTIAGGVPRSVRIETAEAASAAATSSLSFLQISDSHIGFPRTPTRRHRDPAPGGRCAINKHARAPRFRAPHGRCHPPLEARPVRPRRIRCSRTSGPIGSIFVPGEHDVLEDDGKSLPRPLRPGHAGPGLVQLRSERRALHRPGQRREPQGGRPRQPRRRAARVARGRRAHLSASTPIVVFAHIPLWSVYPEWGWGTADAAQALG